MKKVDERTAEEKTVFNYLVIGTDSFLSGWGEAEGGVSIAAWACKPDDSDRVYRWVASRSEMKRVRTVYEGHRKYNPKGTGHCHIYVCREGHPALSW